MLPGEMEQSCDESRAGMKRALLRTIIRAQSEGTLLDSEDEEMMVRYGMGEITKGGTGQLRAKKGGGPPPQ